jgi:hypothetical protein
MALLQITSALGDSPTRSIPLVVDVEADQTPFTPTVNWVLLLTAKALLTDPDGAAKFQLKTGLGITHTGSSAVCALAPTATLGTAPANLYFDIRATHQITGETHLVARGRWNLIRPATRLAIPSMPIYTMTPGTGPDLSAMTGLGAGIKTAMALPTGTTGAVQLVGDVQTPSSITLPDVTGFSVPLNQIGMAGGRLVVGNGSAVGGVLVAPRRFTGMSIVGLNGQTKAKAFTKVFGIPMTAAEMTSGRKFKIIGHVTASPNTERGTVIPYTNQRMGWGFLSSSNTAQPMMGFFEQWKAQPLLPPTAFNANYAANRLQKVRYDIATLLGHTAWPQFVSTDGDGGDSAYGVTYYNGGGATTASAIGTDVVPGVVGANEMCWMWQIESGQAGNYSTETMLFEWDVELQVVI